MVWAWRSTFDLDATPARLESAAIGMRRIGTLAETAQDTVDVAAHSVSSEGAWRGSTAASYQRHRRRLTGALGELSTAADDAATALAEIATVLRRGQGMLDDERARLADIRQEQRDEGWLYGPQDDEEAKLVETVTSAAEEIRGWVDGEILARRPALDAAQEELAAVRDSWEPRQLRHVNLNAAMFPGAGVVRGNLDELARSIASGDPDVVTLQEVYEYNLHGDDGLLAQLEQVTGAEWEVAAFGQVNQHNVDFDPDVAPGLYPVGNAVLVRTDRVVASSEEQQPLDLNIDGYEDGSKRGAAVTELTLAEPDR